MAVPIARHLVEFPSHDRARHPHLSDFAGATASARASAAPSLAEQLIQAHGRGREEGIAAARAEFEIALADERGRFEERLAAERLSWTAEQADRLSGELLPALQELEARIADAVGRILTPFMQQSLRDSIVSDLSEALQRVLANDRSAVLQVSGPDDLLQALREKLGPHATSVEYRAEENAELRVIAGETVLETQLEAWAERLQQAGG